MITGEGPLRTLLTVLPLSLGACESAGDEDPDAVAAWSDVARIVDIHCAECHPSLWPSFSREQFVEDAEDGSGRLVVAGDPDARCSGC